MGEREERERCEREMRESWKGMKEGIIGREREISGTRSSTPAPLLSACQSLHSSHKENPATVLITTQPKHTHTPHNINKH